MTPTASDHPRLIVHKGPIDILPEANGAHTMPFERLVESIKNGSILKLLARYRQVTLRTPQLEELTSPFHTALAVKSLSRGPVLIEDDTGRRLSVSWTYILKQFHAFFCEFLDGRSFTLDMKKAVDRATRDIQRRHYAPVLDPGGRPVYLRTDLTHGLQAGGSIGHIAGVLNNLDNHFNPPVFLTNARIPTVNPDIETHRIAPSNRFKSLPELRYLDYNQTVVKACDQCMGNGRIAFIYQRYSLNSFAGYTLARRHKVPFVLEYNGSEIWVGKNWGQRVQNEKLSNTIELLNLCGADLVVVVSDALKTEIVKRGVNPQKILVNPNGVDTERYSPDTDGSGVRKQFGLDGRTVLGFIGTFGRWHGADVLVDAFALLLKAHPDYRKKVVLMCIGDGMMLPSVKARALENKISAEIIFTGVVPQEKGPKYLAACDILISPHVPNPDGTPFFGSPTKLFEYMAMGKGIVASRLGQIKDVLEHKRTALMVRPACERELMTAMEIMVASPEIRHRLGANARKEVVGKYTWKNHTDRIVEALEGMRAR